ncbi:hypothetical protein BDV26DRAFT_253793 [Aspergillus bertholletiae]|uniref:Histidine phosphatase superfamily n=1 Tax=Aspergillus bertholletiae TaxID=1226010 RepID=A0A5N7BKL4_9EURO|nr:hypothetical protein BDV26DRAFT_253793 [Aspergillus bertholletiae]
MGKAPAAIIIARHGARLDAADKNWHLTSPTPYDPPLSYGGWLQSRALGARIANVLQSLDTDILPENTDAETLPSFRPRPVKRKRRIIIHSSPYLRCLQTSIAISSGISQQYPDSTGPGPSWNQPDGFLSAPVMSSAQEPTTGAVTSASVAPGDQRCLLRVDAFLGEWLSPDYFEEITPPPKSERLVAASKVELLRRDSIVPEADTKPPTGFFPGGWGSLGNKPLSPPIEDQDCKTYSVCTPNERREGQRNRAGSCDTLRSADTPRSRRLLSKINTNLPPIPDGAYLPPTPSYAISPSGPIPTGYVTHARDACVRIDYPWDSMRDPPNWGNGGEYGEEWSTMHRRFHTGLERMVAWYQEHDVSLPSGRRRRHSQLSLSESAEESKIPDDEDDPIDTILVIVTHGAGCNAIIGAITGEPALVDINTASLTLAVPKERVAVSEKVSAIGGPVAPYRPGGEQVGLRDYKLQLVASTDHLRPATNLSTSILSSPGSLTSPSSAYRPRFTPRPSLPQGGFVIGPSSVSGPGTGSWTFARPSTAPRGASGLWGSNSISAGDVADDIIPNFGDPWSGSNGTSDNDPHSGTKPEESSGWAPQLPQRTLSQRGLWGSGPLKETPVKRRWTVTERRV